MQTQNLTTGRFDRLMRYLFRATNINTLVDEGKVQLNVRAVLSIYWESLRKSLRLVIFVISLTALSSILAIIVPTYYKDFFNVFAKGLSVSEAGELLFHAILAILALDLFSLILRRTAMFGLVALGRKVMIDLRVSAFDHVIRHSHAYYTSVFVGALVQKLSRFQKSYDRLADSVVFYIVPTIVTLVGVMFVLFRESPLMASAMLLWIILIVAINYYFAKWMLRYNIYRAALDSRVTGMTADMFTNQAAIEAHGTYDLEKAKHKDITEQQMHAAAFTWNTGTLYHSIQELSVVFIKYAVFAVGITFWMRGNFPLGMFMLIHAYVFQVTERIWPIGQVVRETYESFADAKEMAEAKLRPHDIIEKDDATPLANVRGAIEFKGVTFDYHGKHVIDNLSVRITPGERVALVGTSGAGKSTFVKLVSRVFDPANGKILVDDVDISTLTIKSLKEAMSSVPQDPVLFHRSLLENIRYGRQSATHEEVVHAATHAHCHDFITGNPLGYDALVGERGVKLSGGERQRVALARAFLKNAPIIILDEATSSLDSGSEELVQDALMHLMEGRTTIVIAHRLSTIRRMDRILVLDKGRLIEDGTHAELLEKQGAYWKLWTLQQNGFIPDQLAPDESNGDRESDPAHA